MAQTKSYATKKKGKTEVYPFWNLEDVYKIPVDIEKEVCLHFSVDGDDYSIKLTRHRKKK